MQKARGRVLKVDGKGGLLALVSSEARRDQTTNRQFYMRFMVLAALAFLILLATLSAFGCLADIVCTVRAPP